MVADIRVEELVTVAHAAGPELVDLLTEDAEFLTLFLRRPAGHKPGSDGLNAYAEFCEGQQLIIPFRFGGEAPRNNVIIENCPIILG